MIVGAWTIVPRAHLLDEGSMVGQVQHTIGQLREQAARDGVTLIGDIDLSVIEETDVARAQRQAQADAWADAEGVERWSVTPVTYLRAEARGTVSV